jgi:hypothetical protein
MESQKVQIEVSETKTRSSWELTHVEGLLPSKMTLSVAKPLELDGLKYPISFQQYAETRPIDDATLEAMGITIGTDSLPDLTRKLLLAATVTSQQLDVQARNHSYIEDVCRQIKAGQFHEETSEDVSSMRIYYVNTRRGLAQSFVPTIELPISSDEISKLQQMITQSAKQ